MRVTSTDWTEQSPLQADNLSASQEIPRLLIEPDDSLPRSQELATGSCPEPDESSPHHHTLVL
jgi:hypothetical protein